MADPNDSSLAFFTKGTPAQWKYVYNLRKDAIQVKADQRSSKKGGPEEFIKLDTWFSTKLPQQIHSRKEPHVVYEELVQIAKWKLMMGKYRPKMLDLVRINTELSVVNTTRKAFKKITQQKNTPPGLGLSQGVQMLVNLKGIGPSTASAIMAAAFPEEAPFMSDEGMLSTPGVEATDSTLLEFNNYSEQLRNKCEALKAADPDFKWNPHKVDQVLWIYYLLKDSKPQLIEAMPQGGEKGAATFGMSNTMLRMVDPSDDNAVGAHEDLNGGCHDDDESNEVGMPTSTSDSLGDSESDIIKGGVALSHRNGLQHSHENSYASGSAAFSEEDISASSSSNMGLPDSSVAHLTNNNNNNNNNNNSLPSSLGFGLGMVLANGTIMPPTPAATNGKHTNGVANNLVTTSHNSTSSSLEELEDDSKDCLEDSEDSRGVVLTSSNKLATITTTTHSEENSVDDGLLSSMANGREESNDCEDEDEDDSQDHHQPPLKKQKTLELHPSVLVSATAAADAGEV